MDNQYVTIKPIHKDLLHAKIADAIMEYIKGNHLKSGDKLPSERNLAEKFSTSRNSVREALRVLEKDKVLEVRAGSGAFIRNNEESASFYLKLWKVNYLEILEIKEVLELYMVQDICGRLTPEQIGQLEAPLEKLEAAAEEKGVFLHAFDMEFHGAMRAFCKNKTLVQMIDKMILSLHAYWKTLKGEDAMWIRTLPFHRQLLDALRDNRLSEAEAAVKKICEIDKNITEWLQEIAGKEEAQDNVE